MKILVRLSAVVCSLLIALSAGAQEKTPLSFGLYTTLGASRGFDDRGLCLLYARTFAPRRAWLNA